MRGLSQFACVLSLLGAASLGGGCSSTNVAVGAKSGAVAAYPSGVGSINTPAFALGDLVAVDGNTGQAWKFASVQFDPTEVAVSQPAGEFSEPFDSRFELAYSKKVAPELEGEVEESVRGNTVLHVENYFTRSLKNPAVFTAGNRQLAGAVLKLHAQNPQAKAFLVSSVTSADRVFLTFEGGPKSTTTAGKYQFHIAYEQNAQLESLAKDTPAFFKTTALKVETDDEGRQFVAADKLAGNAFTGTAVADIK